ncbi:hypothetical protein ACQ27_gp095 [Klebsiella phage K64-1]|nr:hypothetical protein ACQ27_gp095 [Klebsiella phage K64-1]
MLKTETYGHYKTSGIPLVILYQMVQY